MPKFYRTAIVENIAQTGKQASINNNGSSLVNVRFIAHESKEAMILTDFPVFIVSLGLSFLKYKTMQQTINKRKAGLKEVDNAR